MASEWIELTIGDLGDIVGGSTPKTSDPTNFNGDIPWLTPKDLSNRPARYVHRGERNLTEKGLSSCSARLLPSNSVLLTTRAPIGYVAIAANPIATNQGFRSIIPKKEFDHEFLYYWLTANKKELERYASGSTFQELAGSVLKCIPIRIPTDLGEQQAISSVLGALDDKIELNSHMNQTLEQIAQTIFKSWFVNFDPVRAKMEGRQPTGMDAETAALFPDSFEDSELGPIPKGWHAKPLSTAIDINPLRSLKKGTPAPYVEMSNLPACSFRIQNWVIREFGSGMRFQNGDTLVARITPCLENGKTGYVDFLSDGEIGWGSTEYIVLRGRPPLQPIHAYFIARDESFRNYAILAMTGSSGRQRVPADSLASYKIVIPPEIIASRFKDFVTPLLAKAKQNDDESTLLRDMRDTLLPKLMSGVIRVPECGELNEALH